MQNLGRASMLQDLTIQANTAMHTDMEGPGGAREADRDGLELSGIKLVKSRTQR